MRGYERELAQAQASIAGHQTSDRRARCFDFRTPKMGSMYAYSLTWTPGVLTLAGDIGELTVIHYNALASLEGGLSWAATSDLDYLLGKTVRRPSYDWEATVREIVRMANEPAIESLQYHRKEVRVWRTEEPARVAFPSTRDGEADFLEERAAWLRARPCLATFLEFTSHYRTGDRLGSPTREAPEGWALWDRLRNRLGSHVPESAFRAGQRRLIRQALGRELSGDGQHVAAELCSDLELDDYYGETRWTYHDIAQMEAIRVGARRALEWLEGEKLYTWHDSLPALAA